MNRRCPIAIASALAATLWSAALAGAAPADPLQSFYIVLFTFSDDPAASYQEILDVAPAGDDVRVRIIRISLAHPGCGAPLVRAVEQVIPHTALATVAGDDMCANTEASVKKALASAKPKVEKAVSEAAAEKIVARCGSEERAFFFPWAQKVDRQKLERSNPRVATLWDTFGRVRRLAFGEFAMNPEPRERQLEFERLGDTLVPELVSGKYQAAYAGESCGDPPDAGCTANYLAWRLRGYNGAPAQRGPLPPELVEAASFRFSKYAPPVFPPIALSARIFGEVRLRITADPETGVVKQVAALAGDTLLSWAASNAARSWQFEPRTLTSPSVDVTVRFEMRCPEDR
jgi:hypothetical protein